MSECTKTALCRCWVCLESRIETLQAENRKLRGKILEQTDRIIEDLNSPRSRIAALESRLAEAELTLMGARDFLKLIAYYDFDPMDVRSSDAAEEIKKIDAALKKLGGKNA